MDKKPLLSTPAKTVGYFGVFLSLLTIFMVMPLLANKSYSFIGLQACLAILLTSISYSLLEKKDSLMTGVWVVFLFIALDGFGFYYNTAIFIVLAYVIYSLYLLFAIILLLRVLMKAPVIDTNIVFGTLSIYLLMGMLWGKLYFMNLMLFPDSFHGVSMRSHNLENWGANFDAQFDLLYYSFTTLATLGMGDITPTHHLSKSLTVLEAMSGQMFVAIVIAKIVSVWRRVEAP